MSVLVNPVNMVEHVKMELILMSVHAVLDILEHTVKQVHIGVLY